MACAGHTHGAKKPATAVSLELADVLERFLGACAPARRLNSEQRRAVRDICRCRTAALGGHLQYCQDCGQQWPVYNSCRNRHCPKCQGPAQLAWIKARLERVLQTHYFHVVFTVPRPLRALARANPQAVYDLLLCCAAQTLLSLGRDPRHLGAELGVTTVLHTWSRDLQHHPHVHCIVTGGGLSSDGTHWIKARRRYLFPGRVMAALFRGLLLAGLEALRQQGELRALGQLAHPVAWADFKDRLYRTRWVVHAKRPFAGAAQVIAYLGRYTHRVAISSSRLLAIDGDRVHFRTRGKAETSLPGTEFVRRFLIHVLPKGFRKIRHYGLMAPTQVRTRLVHAQLLLAPKPPHLSPDDPAEPTAEDRPLPIWQPRCPACGSTRLGHTYVPLPDYHPAATAGAARPPPVGPPPEMAHA